MVPRTRHAPPRYPSLPSKRPKLRLLRRLIGAGMAGIGAITGIVAISGTGRITATVGITGGRTSTARSTATTARPMDGAGPTGIVVTIGIGTTGTAGIGTTVITTGAGSTDA